MKKLTLTAIIAISALALTTSAYADSTTIKPGQSKSCNNANSITLEASGSHPTDRSNANAVVWKSSNFTTIPVTLGPGDHNSLAGGREVGMPDKHAMGQKSITFNRQENFSRGDSIGDISGEVRIENTGTIDINVNCK